MALPRDRPPSDRPPGWPAWCISILIHVAILGTALAVLRDQARQRATILPLREAGIVLKRMTDQGERFEGEQDHTPPDATTTARQSLTDATISALPTAAEIRKLDAQPNPSPTIGAEVDHSPALRSAREMTSGASPDRRLGGQTTVRVFGVAGTGSKFVYVFDRSISMQGGPLRAAKAQLVASLAALESVHQFQIIFFNHEPQAWDLTGGQQRIAFATEENKRRAKKFVRGMNAAGGTYRRGALQLALQLRPDVIFFLTDADDPMPDRDIREAILRAEGDATVINTIEFGVGPQPLRESFLVGLARATRGQYTYVDTQELE